MIETKQTVVGNMVSIEVDLCMQKNYSNGINSQGVVDGNLWVITTAVNELHKRARTAAIHKNIVSSFIFKKNKFSFMIMDPAF